MTSGAHFPRPDEPVAVAQSYFSRFAEATRISAFLVFVSALPLAVAVSTVTSKLQYLGVRATGVSVAQFGGYASAIFLAIAGLTAWILGQPGVAEEAASVRTLEMLGFAAGGVAHVATFGQLMAGVSITSGFAKLLPRWLIVFGVTLAVLAGLSTLGLVFKPVFVLIPIVRFFGFVWLISVGFLLGKEPVPS